jgi:hypothetical protein
MGIFGGGKTILLFGLPPGYTSSRNRFCSLNMWPPKNMVLAEFFKPMEKRAKPLRSSLQRYFYLPGHSGVSEVDSLLRERPGAFPFDMEDKF